MRRLPALKDAGHLVSVLNGVFGEMEKYLEKPGGEDGRDHDSGFLFFGAAFFKYV